MRMRHRWTIRLQTVLMVGRSSLRSRTGTLQLGGAVGQLVGLEAQAACALIHSVAAQLLSILAHLRSLSGPSGHKCFHGC